MSTQFQTKANLSNLYNVMLNKVVNVGGGVNPPNNNTVGFFINDYLANFQTSSKYDNMAFAICNFYNTYQLTKSDGSTQTGIDSTTARVLVTLPDGTVVFDARQMTGLLGNLSVGLNTFSNAFTILDGSDSVSHTTYANVLVSKIAVNHNTRPEFIAALLSQSGQSYVTRPSTTILKNEFGFAVRQGTSPETPVGVVCIFIPL